MNNDKQVQQSLDIVESKLKALQKPTSSYVTNCSLTINEKSTFNLRTITELNTAVYLTGQLLQAQHLHKESCLILKIDIPFIYNGYSFEDWFHDIKLHVDILVYKQSEKDLKTIKTRLEGLMSKDMKDSIELDNIMKILSGMK